MGKTKRGNSFTYISLRRRKMTVNVTLCIIGLLGSGELTMEYIVIAELSQCLYTEIISITMLLRAISDNWSALLLDVLAADTSGDLVSVDDAPHLLERRGAHRCASPIHGSCVRPSQTSRRDPFFFRKWSSMTDPCYAHRHL